MNLKGQALHAAVLGFVHPRSKEWLEFSAAPPETFRETLNILGSEYIFEEEKGDVRLE
jgi:23S rRNA pseudouridine1911/1915/1917 synthase